MVTISRATLSVSVAELMRDILRNNVADPALRTAGTKWIYKDDPALDVDEDNMPIVIIKEDSMEWNTYGNGATNAPANINLSIMVYSMSPYQRDTIADDIRSTLLDVTSVDANNETLYQNLVVVKSISSSTNDIYAQYPKPYRIKQMDVTLRYRGG